MAPTALKFSRCPQCFTTRNKVCRHADTACFMASSAVARAGAVVGASDGMLRDMIKTLKDSEPGPLREWVFTTDPARRCGITDEEQLAAMDRDLPAGLVDLMVAHMVIPPASAGGVCAKCKKRACFLVLKCCIDGCDAVVHPECVNFKCANAEELERIEEVVEVVCDTHVKEGHTSAWRKPLPPVSTDPECVLCASPVAVHDRMKCHVAGCTMTQHLQCLPLNVRLRNEAAPAALKALRFVCDKEEHSVPAFAEADDTTSAAAATLTTMHKRVLPASASPASKRVRVSDPFMDAMVKACTKELPPLWDFDKQAEVVRARDALMTVCQAWFESVREDGGLRTFDLIDTPSVPLDVRHAFCMSSIVVPFFKVVKRALTEAEYAAAEFASPDSPTRLNARILPFLQSGAVQSAEEFDALVRATFEPSIAADLVKGGAGAGAGADFRALYLRRVCATPDPRRGHGRTPHPRVHPGKRLVALPRQPHRRVRPRDRPPQSARGDRARRGSNAQGARLLGECRETSVIKKTEC